MIELGNLAAIVTAGLFLATIAGALLAPVIRGRRARARARAQAAPIERLQTPELEQLLAKTSALPAPDELPQARDLTQGERRRLRGRQHPIGHKRDGKRW